MNEHLRRPESFGISDDARVQLEGGVERLEDAVPLFEAAVTVVDAPSVTHDDLTTLSEVITQLPRLDETLDAARRHETTSALVATVTDRRRRLADAVNRLLPAEPPSLVEGLRQAHRLLRRRKLMPADDETRFATGGGNDGVLWSLVVLGAVIAGVDRVGHGDWSRWWVGALVTVVLFLLARKVNPKWWVLADRIHTTNGTLWFADITRVDKSGEQMHIASDDAFAFVDPPTFELISLLRTPWFTGASTKPLGRVVEDADGLRLETPAGALVVPHASGAAAVKALGGASSITLHRVFALLSHLPAEKLAAAAEHLVKTADAKWTPQIIRPMT